MKNFIKYIFIITILLIVSFFAFSDNANAESDTEITFGSEYVFNMASTSAISLNNLSSSKVIIVYKDGGGNFNQGTAIIANISDNAITYGSEYVFNDAATDYISTTLLSETKLLIVYQDIGNSNYGTAVIADISGNEITFGLEYVFNTALTEHVSVTALSESKFVVVYQDLKDGFRQGKAMIGEINNNVISFGSEYVFNTASVNYVSVATLLENKFALVYQDIAGGNQGTAIIGTVSDKNISFSSKYVFNTANTRDISIAIFSENKIAVAYKDQGGNNYGRAIIGEINGDVITYGLEYVFNSAATNYVSIDVLSENKFAIAYQDYGGNQYGTAVIANISGTEITFGSEYVFNTAITGITFTKALLQSKFIVSYQDGAGNLNYGTAVIGTIPEPEPVPVEPEPEPEPEPEILPEPEPEPELITIIDGDLIRNPNAQDITKFDIYIVKLINNKKFKRLILSPHVFESYEHLSWDNIKNIDQTTMDVYTTSNLVRAANNTKVYKLTADGDTGIKQWLNITAEEFISQGYDSDSIYEINATDRDAYETGEDIN